MLMPSIYERNLFDNFFDDFTRPVRPAKPSKCIVNRPLAPIGTMKTDILEKEEGFEIAMELPGYKKENVKAELNEGYLTVTAASVSDEEHKDEKTKFIRRERFIGECKRSFYVGEDIEPEDIKARFEDGVLKLEIPKKAPKPEEEKKTTIQIEG